MDSFLSSVLSINYLALTLCIPLIGFFIVTACPRTSRLPFFYAMVSSLGAFLAGLKAYHFDAAFQFADRTLYQVWIILAAALLYLVDY